MDIRPESLRDLAAIYPGRFAWTRADTTDEKEVARALGEAVQRFGPLACAFNVVGGGRASPVLEQNIDDWTHTITLSLTSTFLCIREKGS